MEFKLPEAQRKELEKKYRKDQIVGWVVAIAILIVIFGGVGTILVGGVLLLKEHYQNQPSCYERCMTRMKEDRIERGIYPFSNYRDSEVCRASCEAEYIEEEIRAGEEGPFD